MPPPPHLLVSVSLLVVDQEGRLVLVLRLDEGLQPLLVVLGPLADGQLGDLQRRLAQLRDNATALVALGLGISTP